MTMRVIEVTVSPRGDAVALGDPARLRIDPSPRAASLLD